jgi:N-acetyl-gamma-glutamylphosphate reductase
MHAYGVGSHRHMPEIEQGLADAAGADITVSFTPHLIPMSRGMQSTMYVEMGEGASPGSLRATLADAYKDEMFVRCAPACLCASALASALDSVALVLGYAGQLCRTVHRLQRA